MAQINQIFLTYCDLISLQCILIIGKVFASLHHVRESSIVYCYINGEIMFNEKEKNVVQRKEKIYHKFY